MEKQVYQYGINGLEELSRKPHTINSKVTKEIEQAILDLRLRTFGTNRIRFRLKRLGIS